MRIGAAGLVLAWMAVLSCYDIRHRRLPNLLTLPGGMAILVGAALAGRGVPALAGAAVLTGVYLLVHLMAPTAMGGGDVKLAIGLGWAGRLLRRRRVVPGGDHRTTADSGGRGVQWRAHRAARSVDVGGDGGCGRAGRVGLTRPRSDRSAVGSGGAQPQHVGR